MLYLLKKDQGPELFYLTQDKEYTIGRKNADIVISDDQSLSRKHAMIKIGSNSATLTDCGSKYGTVHNNVKMAANSEISLSDKDVIKFGVYQSIYKVDKVSVVTTGSGLTNEQKRDLKLKIHSLNGSVMNNWDDTCTFLTSQEIILTIKVLHALIDEKPIVTLEYWSEFVKNMKSGKAPPNVASFKPPIAEALINRINLSPNPERTVLFRGKTFVFTTEKIKKKMADLIAKTGGSCVSWERHPLTLLELTKSKNKYLLIHNDDPDDIPQTLKDIGQQLKKLGERMIPIQEIAMAIVLCSCEMDCNPKFNRVDKVFKMASLDSLSMTPLVENTPSDDGWVNDVVTKREIIIPQSLDAELEIFPSPKFPSENVVTSTPFLTPSAIPKQSAKRVENEPAQNPSKRIKLGDEISERSDSSKKEIESHGANETLKSVIEISGSVVTEQMATPSTSNTPTSAESESRKRKSEENSDFTPERPFVVTKKKRVLRNSNAEENPFVAFRVKKEETEDDGNNPFLQIISRKEESKAKPTQERPVETCPLTFVRDNYIPTDTSKIEWLSVNDIKKESTPSEESILDTSVDPQIKEIFESFKDSVVIEILPMSAIRTPPSSYASISLDTTTGKRNFKKFKKVRPRHPQTTILSTSVYGQGAQVEQIPIRSDGEEEDREEQEAEPEVRRRVAKKSTRPKHFDF